MSKYVCNWKSKSKNVKQQYCCYITSNCHGKKCHKTIKKCRWVGSELVTSTHQSCNYSIYGKHSKRMKCCRHKNQCHSIKGCKTMKLGCIWSGPVIKEKISKKCSERKLPNYQFRNKCCVFKTKCIGGKCSTKKFLVIGKVK